MRKEETKKLPKIGKIGAFMELCSRDVREIIFQSIDEIGEDDEKLKHKVLAWVSNRIAASQMPVPMDVGNVERPWKQEEEEGRKKKNEGDRGEGRRRGRRRCELTTY